MHMGPEAQCGTRNSCQKSESEKARSESEVVPDGNGRTRPDTGIRDSPENTKQDRSSICTVLGNLNVQ
jgi:hypothetical protein